MAPTNKTTPSPNVVALNDENATKLVIDAVQNRANIDVLVASGEMKIFDRATDFSLSVQIENMVAVHPDKLRMKTTKLAGNVEVFDVLMRDGKVAFFVPRHKTLYSGNISDLQSGGINFSPDVILSRLLRADEHLSRLQWQSVPVPKNSRGRGAQIELEQTHKKGESYLRVTIDPPQKTILRVAYYNANNQEYLVEEYDNYQPIANGKLFPTRFNLNWTDKNRYVKMNLKRHDVTRRLSEVAEAFEGIDNVDFNKVQRKALGQARIESDS